MEEAKCPECGATIGGQRHRLRDDNQLAPEMDGADMRLGQNIPIWPILILSNSCSYLTLRKQLHVCAS